MDRVQFWTIIDEARGLKPTTPNPKQLPSTSAENLRSALDLLPTEEIASFGTIFNDLLIELNRWSIWGAGYVIAGGMSDDSFHYFRSWLIGKGREAVEQALTNPDGLGPYVDDPDVDNELLEYAAIELLEQRGAPDPRDGQEASADDTPTEEPFDEETVFDEYPRLAAQFE